MRVLMTADAVGGVWSYAMTLCASLQSQGVEVTLATLGPRPTADQARAAAELNNVRLFSSDYRLEWMPEGWKDQEAAGEWLLELADAEAVDVVHLNGYALASLAWQRPTVCVAHSCVSSWWRAVHGAAAPIEWQAYRRGVVEGLNGADQVVAPTNAFLAELKDCHEGSWPARVIYNGMLSSFPSATADPKAMKLNYSHPRHRDVPAAIGGERPGKSHAFSHGRHSASGRMPESLFLNSNEAAVSERRQPIVFACGRPWDAAKNMGVLDEAARELAWPVYLAGDLAGPDGSGFAGSTLRTLGALPSDEVASWLRRASIFVHPALYEPFGLAVAEAAASGCALVLADIPTLRELWDGAAEFFHPRDASELSAAVNALIVDPIRRRELGIAAKERAASYTPQAMADRYCDLYVTLIDASSRDAGVRHKRVRLAPSTSGITQAQAVRV